MTDLQNFATQNWVMTPVARPGPSRPPPNAPPTGGATLGPAQRWLLTLSGVVFAEVKGKSSANWFGDTLSFRPALNPPIGHVINEYGLKTPPGFIGQNFNGCISVDQYALFAGPTAVFNRGTTAQVGFAVDNWRENAFGEADDLLTNVRFGRLFDGLQVDVAVRDADVTIHRISYHVTLYGRIVFLPMLF